MSGPLEVCGDFSEEGQRLFRFLDVQARDGKAGMHDDVIADLHIIDQPDRDSSANSADFDVDPLIIEECCHSNRHSQAHASGPYGARVGDFQSRPLCDGAPCRQFLFQPVQPGANRGNAPRGGADHRRVAAKRTQGGRRARRIEILQHVQQVRFAEYDQSLARKITGYFAGLSSPSVTLRRVTLRC